MNNTYEEIDLIDRIVNRHIKEAKAMGIKTDPKPVLMKMIVNVHSKELRLDLKKFLAHNPVNFKNDFNLIEKNYNWMAECLNDDCFTPKCARSIDFSYAS